MSARFAVLKSARVVVIASAAASLLWLRAAAAPATIGISNLVYRGCYQLTSSLGRGAALAYAPARGTWFVVSNRNLNFDLKEVHLPDDAAYPGGPVDPIPDQTVCPSARLVQDWGTALSTTDPTVGPIDPTQDEVGGAYWDDVTSRLYVSFGDFYGATSTTDSLVSIDVSGATPRVLGPWSLGSGRTPFVQHWSWSQFFKAPPTLTNQPAAGRKQFIAAGKDTNTFQDGSWGPGQMLCEAPTDSTPPHSILPCQQLMFWASHKIRVTLDDGDFKNAILTSDMLRRDPLSIIVGHSPQTLGGAPLWCDVPYGRSIGTPASGNAAFQYFGWGNEDDSGHWACIDESDLKGCISFGNYTVGTQWYGNPRQFADDTTPYAGENGCPSSSPTGFRSFAGIMPSPPSQVYFRSSYFPADPILNPKDYVYSHRGGGKGNRAEHYVPAAWFYSLDDLVAGLNGTYTPRPGLANVNIDFTSFAVLAAQFAVPDMQQTVVNYQYQDVQTPYQSETANVMVVDGAYFRPSGVSGVGRRLYVRVTSRNSAVDLVNVFDLTTASLPALPAAPANLTASSTGVGSVVLSWTDMSNNEDRFEIWRCVGDACASFTLLATAPARTTSFNDNGVVPGTTYRYEVRSGNRAGVSAFAAAAQVTVSGPRGPRNHN
jgi:hypothetical protein